MFIPSYATQRLKQRTCVLAQPSLSKAWTVVRLSVDIYTIETLVIGLHFVRKISLSLSHIRLQKYVFNLSFTHKLTLRSPALARDSVNLLAGKQLMAETLLTINEMWETTVTKRTSCLLLKLLKSMEKYKTCNCLLGSSLVFHSTFQICGVTIN